MVTINGQDIYKILEAEGYDCDVFTDDEWELYNEDWEEECTIIFDILIEQDKEVYASDWADRLQLKKKPTELSKNKREE